MSDVDPTVIGSPQPAYPDASQPERSGMHGNALPSGSRVQEFEVEGLVGEGGFSVVYRARDTLLGRTIALKEYMPSSLAQRSEGQRVVPRTERQRPTFELGLRSFVNEARLLASFDHPALVKVYRFWEENGTAYLVMPLYHGPTLREWLAREGGRADEVALLQMLHPLLDALEVMHAQQCYHRDIAPDNILLLDDDNAGVRPLLLDFGAARRVIGGATQALTVILKPGYAPIEQYAETPQARQGPWTDIYALCATLYDAVTGRVPEPSVGRLIHDGLTPASGAVEGLYSRALLTAIDRGMAVKPDERLQSVQALRALLPRSPKNAKENAAAVRDEEATVILDPAQAAAVLEAARAASAPIAAVARTTQATQTGQTGQAPASPPASRNRDVRSEPRGRPALLVAIVPLSALLLMALAWWWATSDTREVATPPVSTPAATSPDVAVPAATPSPLPSPSPAPSPAPSPTPSITSPTTPQITSPPTAPAPFTVLAALQDIAAGSDPAIAVQAKATKPRLVIGRDRLGFSVQSSQAGYVYVFASGTDQSHFHLLFPNARDKRNRVDAARTLQLPRESWVLESAGPPGVNHLLVVVSRNPRSFDGTGLVTKDQDIPAFELADAKSRWAARSAGERSPFIGRVECAAAQPACAQGYGAALLSVEEIGAAR